MRFYYIYEFIIIYIIITYISIIIFPDYFFSEIMQCQY